MKVYDQLLFPDVEGVVTNTNYIPEKVFFDEEEDFEEDYEHPYPIEVDFKGQQALYKNDGSCLTDFPTLSTKPYKVELVGFEQKESVPTFEEAVRWLETTEGTNIMNDSVFLTKGNYYTNLNECTEALKKLILLRDYYNEGWQPNWDDSSLKYIVYIKVDNGCNFIIDYRAKYPRVLHFKSKEIAEKFLKEQKKLLEIAKPLL